MPSLLRIPWISRGWTPAMDYSLCSWSSLGKNTVVGCHSLLQGIFLTQGLNPSLLQCRRPRFYSWVRKIHWRKGRLLTPVLLGFPCGLAGKESACNVGELGSIPGLGWSPGEGSSYPLQYSGLENSMDCIVHGVTNRQTRLSDFHKFIRFCLKN